jgi:hemin uptake protein HemP
VVPNDSSEPSPRSQEDDRPLEIWREIDSKELMRGDREIVIRHGTKAYRLSVTRSGKLILRK